MSLYKIIEHMLYCINHRKGEAKINELGTRMKADGRVEEFMDSLSDGELQR